ncbi:S1 family peptidase, partial [Streptomyces sp. T-3]|nr:S1 family peptidase [Streptomyces sp. T-3]
MKRTTPLLAALAALPLTLLSPGSSGAAPTADAEPGPGVAASSTTYSQNAQLKRELGSRSAGSYLDAGTGELITTVTSEADAAEVRA